MPDKPIIAAIGEILVEFVSHERNCGLEKISRYSGPYPSGAPAIFIDQVARMGSDTTMIGGVGDDGFGRAVIARLEADNVGTGAISVSPDLSTGVAFVTYYDDGSRDFIFHMNGSAADHFEVYPSTLNLSATWLHVSGASLGNSRLRSNIMKLVAAVHGAGGKITCDPNVRPELMRAPDASIALTQIINISTILLPSTSDLPFLYPELAEDEAIEKMLNSKVEIVVLKRGAAGATIIHAGQRLEFKGCFVDEIDPTGAGDCFCGTFVSLIAQGYSVSYAGKYANAAGALAVTRRGPMEGNSTPQEIQTFLNADSRVVGV